MLSRVDDALDEPKQRGMKRLVQIADVLVRSVDSQRILDQIVRADGEEVRFLGQDVSDHRRGGNLDHDPDLQVGVVGDPLFIQFSAYLADKRLYLPQLLDAGDQRKHDLEVSKHRRAQQRAELRLEHVNMFHAQAQPAQP